MHKRTKRILSFFMLESDESELEESRGPEAGAIEPHIYEPVVSESEEVDSDDTSDHDEEERWDNTDLNNSIHARCIKICLLC